MTYFLYSLFVILPIYEDAPLAIAAGAYGYSLMPALSIVMVIPVLALLHRPVDGFFTKRWGVLTAYLLVLNCISILVWVASGHSELLRGESVYFKAIKGFMFTLSAFAYLVVFRQLSAFLDEKQACRPFVWAFAILTVVAVVELVQSPYAFSALHFSGELPYWRPRFLSTEASWTCMLIVVYGGISLHYYLNIKRNAIGLGAITCALILMVATTGSKSLLAIIAAILIVLWYQLVKRDARFLLIAPIVLIVFFGAGLFERLTGMVTDDIENYSSIATRLYSWFVSIKQAIIYPFGTGNALYVDIFPRMLIDNLNILKLLPFHTKTYEIYQYATDVTSDAGLSAKSGLLQYGLYIGIIGVIYIVWSFIKGIKQVPKTRRMVIIKSLAIICLIAICFVMNFDYEYELYAFLGLLDWYLSDCRVEASDHGIDLQTMSRLNFLQ